MPAIVTKYPDVVIDILSHANMSCGQGNQPNILITCPAPQFCSSDSGELCVYGVKDTLQTGQIQTMDLLNITSLWLPIGGLILLSFLSGFVFGRKMTSK